MNDETEKNLCLLIDEPCMNGVLCQQIHHMLSFNILSISLSENSDFKYCLINVIENRYFLNPPFSRGSKLQLKTRYVIQYHLLARSNNRFHMELSFFITKQWHVCIWLLLSKMRKVTCVKDFYLLPINCKHKM